MTGRSGQPAVGTADRLRTGARALDISLDDLQIDALCLFLDELERWNARTNLVGEHDRATLIERHVLDALAAVPVLREVGSELSIVDIGSGAGLPGVPLAVALRPRMMWLVEPRRKRASFLRTMRRVLPALAMEVVEERAEHLANRSDLAGSIDAVVSRAALSDVALETCARPLLRAGGLLVAYRGGGDRASENPCPGVGFAGPVSRPYALEGARRTFRLDVWTRCFT